MNTPAYLLLFFPPCPKIHLKSNFCVYLTVCFSMQLQKYSFIILPPVTSCALLPPSLPPSCNQCCIPAAVIHSGSYLLCILWSRSPHLTLSLSLLPLFFFPPLYLFFLHIVGCVLLCIFISWQLFCCYCFLSFPPPPLHHRRITEVSIQPLQAAYARAQADEALLSSANQAVCAEG